MSSRTSFQPTRPRAGREASARNHLVRSPEETIVQILLHYPNLVNEFKDREVIDYFESPMLKNIAEALLHQPTPIHDDNRIKSVYDVLPNEESKDLFTRLSLDDSVPVELETARMMLHDRLEILKRRRIKIHRKQLQAALEEQALLVLEHDPVHAVTSLEERNGKIVARKP